MIFSKKEVIELSGGKKYIVAELYHEDDNWYYCLLEVNKDETTVGDELKIITTVSENNNIFIKNIKGKKADDLKIIFKEKLNL